MHTAYRVAVRHGVSRAVYPRTWSGSTATTRASHTAASPTSTGTRCIDAHLLPACGLYPLPALRPVQRFGGCPTKRAVCVAWRRSRSCLRCRRSSSARASRPPCLATAARRRAATAAPPRAPPSTPAAMRHAGRPWGCMSTPSPPRGSLTGHHALQGRGDGGPVPPHCASPRLRASPLHLPTIESNPEGTAPPCPPGRFAPHTPALHQDCDP
jgi:hypothetical protein